MCRFTYCNRYSPVKKERRSSKKNIYLIQTTCSSFFVHLAWIKYRKYTDYFMSIYMQFIGTYLESCYSLILYFQKINHRHTTNDQSTWLHQQLMIVEETDQKTRNQPLGMLIETGALWCNWFLVFLSYATIHRNN
jgi:hypothetical protein